MSGTIAYTEDVNDLEAGMDHLWTPWRMRYLQGEDRPSDGSAGCVFCVTSSENRTCDVDNLIVRRGQRAFVILNRYPYNNGHLMVVPYLHVPSLEQLDAETLAELMALVQQSLSVLRAIYRPQAFNLGMNIGEAAGAGIAEHVHFHVVPRWAGDTNYMTVVGQTRIIPEDLPETCRRLCAAWPESA
jgi:ATP adenylyltransferase